MVDQIKFNFTENDLLVNQDSSNIVIKFGDNNVTPPVNSCDIYFDPTKTSFNCKCSVTYDTSNDFLIDCSGNTTFGTIKFYHGETASSGLNIPYGVKVSVGENVNATISYAESAKLDVRAYTGENFIPNVRTAYGIVTSINSGENVTAELKYAESAKLSFSAYYGEYVYTDIKKSIGLSASSYYGESADLKLEVPQSKKLDFSVYTGENVYNTVAISYNISTSVLYGETANSLISISAILAPNISYGDSVSYELSVPSIKLLDFNINHGENVSTNIISSAGISTNSYYGESVNVDIDYRERLGMQFNVYHGEQVSLDYVRDVKLSANMYHGERLYPDITYKESYKISANMYHGEQALLSNMIYPINLGRFNINHGEILSVVGLDELPNNYIYHGETSTFDMSTETKLVPRFYMGENVVSEIRFGPSEPVGAFTSKHGEQVDFELKTMVSHKFNFLCSFNMDFSVNRWKTTYVDLNRKTCCPPSVSDLLYVDLSREPDTDLKYDSKNMTKVGAELSVTRLFNFNVYHGTTFKVAEYDKYLSFDCYHGEGARVKDLYNELHVDLTMGNVDNTDVIVIETDKPYVEYQTSFANNYIGEAVNFDLSIKQHYPFTVSHGQDVKFELQTSEAIRLYCYHGEMVRYELATNVRIPVSVSHGENVYGNFYHEPYVASYGENVKFDLTMEYDVEFLESGCLLNTHIPVDKDGVPIIDDGNEMAVEGKFYSRYVQGRCF